MHSRDTRLFSLLFFIILFLLSPYFSSKVSASLFINEFSSASNPEWVELYNSDEQAYSLKGVVLFFDAASDTTQKMSFCDSDEMAPKSYKLITRPINSYWLSNSGDTLILKKEDDIVDSISYGTGQVLKAPTATQSASRLPDLSTWFISNNPSPQGNEASFVCPTSTPTPTDTPVPTSTPTQTPVPTNTPKPTPSLTPTPKLSPGPSSTEEATQSSILIDPILGESTTSAPKDNLSSNSGKAKNNKTQQNNENNKIVASMSLGVSFIAFCGIIWFYFKKRKKKEINEDE